MKTRKLIALSVPVLVLSLAAGCSSDDDDGGGGTQTPGGGEMPGGGGMIGGDSGVAAMPFDRVGRPGVSTALIAEDPTKDAYNADGNPASWDPTFRTPMIMRLDVIDGLDGTTGNALLMSSSDLAGVLLDDRLRIDTSVPECDVYLALEIGLGGCGGRTLERDVIDDTLRHLVSQTDPVSDLADFNEVILDDWPFLSDPNPATAP